MGMIPVNCPNCGADIQLDDSREFGFCNYCGTKVIQEKVVVEHRGSVQLDKKSEIDNYLKIIKRNAKKDDVHVIREYCKKILEIDAENVEANLYQVIAQRMVIDDLRLKMINSSSEDIIELVKSKEQSMEEAIKDLKSIEKILFEFTNYVLAFRIKLHNDSNGRHGGFIFCVQLYDIMYSYGESIEKYFDAKNESYKTVIAAYFKDSLKLMEKFERETGREYNDKYKMKYNNKLAEYDSNYAMITIKQEESSDGCYVATAIYGSYDCPEVWTLRRYRDNQLAKTWHGRLFIHTYYAISPTLVKWFGNTQWFKNMWKPKLDKMVDRLQKGGVENTPYQDRNW